MTGVAIAAGAAFLGLLLGRAMGRVRQRLLLEVFYGLMVAGSGATAEEVGYYLRQRPWAPRSVYFALRQLERMGLVRGWDGGDPLGRSETRCFSSPAARPKWSR